MESKLSQHFTYKRLIQYVLPCIAMMIVTSIYSIVDGFFVSNYVGKNAFAAINLVIPVTMGLAAVGFMIGAGGAALASSLGMVVGGLVPFLFFTQENHSGIRLKLTKFDSKSIIKACTNGASELLTNICTSLISIVYNLQLIKIAKENGLAAYGVIMYVSFIFVAIFIGYAIGINPIIGYHHGAGNKNELHNILKKSLIITSIVAVAMVALSELLALPIAKLFVGYDDALCQMTKIGFMLFSTSYLLCGFNIFSSAFFTGLGDGKVSAAISFFRTFVAQLVAIIILPKLWGLNGIFRLIFITIRTETLCL